MCIRMSFKQVTQYPANKKASKVLTVLQEFLKYLKSADTSQNIKLVLLKTLRYFMAQFDFNDSENIEKNEDLMKIWQNTI